MDRQVEFRRYPEGYAAEGEAKVLTLGQEGDIHRIRYRAICRNILYHWPDVLTRCGIPFQFEI